MTKIAVYHWLPIAANQRIEIQSAIKAGATGGVRLVDDSSSDGDIRYDFNLSVKVSGDRISDVLVSGCINERGFAAHTTTLGFEAHGGLASHATRVDLAVEALSAAVSELLYALLPVASRNELAVLEEGIVGFGLFPSYPFSDTTARPAMDHLARAPLFVVQYEPGEWERMHPQGFVQYSLGELRFKPNVETQVLANLEEGKAHKGIVIFAKHLVSAEQSLVMGKVSGMRSAPSRSSTPIEADSSRSFGPSETTRYRCVDALPCCSRATPSPSCTS